MQEKRELFDRIRQKIKEGDEEVIHFIMTSARNIISYQLKNKGEDHDGNQKDD